MNSFDIGPRKLRVAVLMGGTSNERAVSLSTGKMILSALDPEKYEVAAIDTQDLLALTPHPPAPRQLRGGKDSQEEINGMNSFAEGVPPSVHLRGHESDTADLVSAKADTWPQARSEGIHSVAKVTSFEGRHRPDVVFIALHGKGGEDGTIQGMLELMDLPYTGSGVLASALAMDKAMSKRLFRTAGIPVIEEIQVRRGQVPPDALLIAQARETLGGFPAFVKPNAEGSTFGCTLVTQPEQLPEAVANALKYDSLALVERYVRGMEVTAGVLEDPDSENGLQALPLIEIIPKNEYYDYESKYAEGGSEHIIPARLDADLTRRIQETALRCHTLLGCRGMSRTDLLVAGDAFYVLEVNTIPGMTPTSLLPQAAAHAGITFSQLLDRLIATTLT